MDITGQSAFLSVLFWLVLGGLVGAAIGRYKGRLIAGILWGGLVGPLGWLLIIVGPSQYIDCASCGERVHKKTGPCKYCGGDIE